MVRASRREHVRCVIRSSLLRSMKTGDLLAFSGKSRTSRLIRWATRSPYSHVALIWRLSGLRFFNGVLVVIESTTEAGLPDAVTHELRKGVQIHFLAQRVDAYHGAVWWVPLQRPLHRREEKAMAEWLQQAHCKRIPYDTAQAIGAGLDLFDHLGLQNEPDYSALFCSELVARALQVAGLLDEAANPSEMTPQDVVSLELFGTPVRIK